jgi:hypothetical protein
MYIGNILWDIMTVIQYGCLVFVIMLLYMWYR